MNLPLVPADKAQHFIYGLAIALVAMYGALVIFGIPRGNAEFIGLAASVVFGFGKEAADHLMNRKNPGTHTVSVGDALATVAGGVVVLVA